MAQNPELHLWRAVVVASLMDAARQTEPKDAAWICSRDFVLVCHLAQVDPQAVLRSYWQERFRIRAKAAA